MRISPKAFKIEKYMALGLSAEEAERAYQRDAKWQEFYAYFVKELKGNRDNEEVKKVFASNKNNPLFQDFLKARLAGENTGATDYNYINEVADVIVGRANEGITKALEDAIDEVEM